MTNAELWAEQILFWRDHLDIFIEEYFQIKLKDVQKVVARQFGRCSTMNIVKSRGFGKTWLTAVCCLAMGVLYPGSLIAVVSGTASQATLVLRKIDDELLKNPNILREIHAEGNKHVQVTISKGKCRLKNGSKIESYSVKTMRGNRAKIVVIDEAPEVKKVDLDAIIKPVRNATRTVCVQNGFPDYASKMVSITSACLKSNYFYEMYMENLKKMAMGDRSTYCCALSFESAARCGITDMDFFMEEKRTMPDTKFQMEYGSIFVGAEANSVFPYDLTEGCRSLKTVETAAPKGGSSSYVMGVDLATSGERSADNAVVTMLKLSERRDGSYIKKLVYIRSYHGKRLDALADEVRKVLIKFPNTVKVVFDHRGLGDAFPQFLSQAWTDPESGVEYPPLVLDDEQSIIHGAKPLLRSVKGNAQINQQLASNLRVALEQRSLQMPVSSKMIHDGKIVDDDEDDELLDDMPQTKKRGGRVLTALEKYVFIETDALQVELGNIVTRVSAAGTYIYDTAKTTQHKDRYSSLAMAVRYVTEMEEKNKRLLLNRGRDACVGVVTSLIRK